MHGEGQAGQQTRKVGSRLDQGNAFKDDPTARARLEAWDTSRMEALAKAFEKGLPSARVVRLLHADHFVIQSHEADVLREMNAFLAKLPYRPLPNE